MAKGLGDGFGIGRPAFVEQKPQRLVHSAFSFLRGQVKNRQIVLDHATGPLVFQDVVSHPKSAGGEHRIAVAVLLERSRLTDQPVDDMAVLDAMLTSAPKSGQSVQLLGTVPDVKSFGTNVNINLFANQSAGQRIGVAADVDRAPGIDPCLDPSGHFQSARRQ